MNIAKLLQLGILPVAGKSVLRKVVGADAEKVYQRRKPVADDGGGGSFYHNANFGAV